MKVSIGISVFNAECFLEDAIKSVLSQTFTDWELIIVDDGSTDNSLQIAKKYESDKIHVYSDGENKKLPYRLNQIVKLAKHDFIARMDADDLIVPERLQVQLEYLTKHPEKDLVSTGVITINDSNKVMGYRFTPKNHHATLLDIIDGKSGIIHASVLARKSWYERNQYDELNIQAEDYQLWLDACMRNDLNVGFIEEPLYCYREDQNINLGKMLRSYRQQIKVVRSFHKKNIISYSSTLKYQSKYFLKMVSAFFIFRFGFEDRLLQRRLQYKDLVKIEEFQKKIEELIIK